MQKQTVFIRAGTLLLGALMLLSSIFLPSDEINAATSYTNPYDFYNSCEENTKTEFVNGYIYFGTKSNKASSYSTRTYSMLGFEVILGEGTDNEIRFNISRKEDKDGEQPYYLKDCYDGKEYLKDGYYYSLYRMSYDDIQELAFYYSPEKAKVLFSQPKLKIRFAGIVTYRNLKDGVVTKPFATVNQYKVEGAKTASGKDVYAVSFDETYNQVFYLSNTAQFNDICKLFSSKSQECFKAFANINDTLDNYLLTIDYYSAESGTKIKTDTAYRWQTFTTASGGILEGYAPTGYHFNTWKSDTGVNPVYANKVYHPSELHSGIETGSVPVKLYPVWQPNTYTVIFDGNGGTPIGTGNAKIVATYDDATDSFPKCMYQKDGYEFAGWKIESVRNEPYQPEDSIYNLTTVNNATLIAVAQWESLEHPIVVNNHGGTGGVDIFYEVYNKGFFLYSQAENSSQNSITKVAIPTLTGKEFTGYFTSASGGKMVVDANGNIVQPNTYFTQSATIHAQYKAVQPTLYFDMQGGEYGTTSTKLTYGSTLPSGLEKPQKSGYTFAGYFSGKDGQGTMYYTENMAPCITCTWIEERTVYAYWVDKNAPTITLKSNYLDWTNKDIILTITADEGTLASDTGTAGLESIVLYRNGEEVFSDTTLNGAKTYNGTYAHPADNSGEGVYIYTLEVTDKSGNKATTMVTVKYDITPPTVVKVERFEVTDTGVDIYVQVNDNKVAAQALTTVELLSLYMENEPSEEETSTEDELPTGMTQPLETAMCVEEQNSSKTTQTMENAEVQEGTTDFLTFDESQIIEDVPSVSMELLAASINANAPPGVSI